ncbi:MAG: S41 family peptidase [Saprospiraceae bacterium]|nr:S41 family peptidase [Saprospiraceae bacterium]
MKKIPLHPVLSLLITLFFSASAYAQSPKELVGEIQQLLLDHYIFLDKAEAMNERLDKGLSLGEFEGIEREEDLAVALTKALQEVTNDKHLVVYPPRQVRVEEDPAGAFLRSLSRYRNPMIKSVQLLDDNVGYFDMRFFGGGESAKKKIDQVMEQLESADALIIDLRYNGGGSISTVQYMCSYFFEGDGLLNSMYSRVNHQLNIENHTREIHVIPVNGKKRPDIPVFVLISSRTFSGAEDFSYTMQSFEKATVIGEASRGGAHPVDFFSLSHNFRIKIPFAMSIHPVTKGNWEGTGVIPNVKVAAADAFDTALPLAQKAAKQHKGEFIQPILDLLSQWEEQPKEVTPLLQHLKKGVQEGKLIESDINRMGYAYLRANKVKTAAAILEANTILFADSPNAFDSFAEALTLDGQMDSALENYQTAVKLATAQEHYNLAGYQQNLQAFKEKQKSDVR